MLASGGYPSKYENGKLITSLEDAEKIDATVYHASTKLTEADYITANGRVLSVTALGESLKTAVDSTYTATATSWARYW